MYAAISTTIITVNYMMMDGYGSFHPVLVTWFGARLGAAVSRSFSSYAQLADLDLEHRSAVSHDVKSPFYSVRKLDT